MYVCDRLCLCTSVTLTTLNNNKICQLTTFLANFLNLPSCYKIVVENKTWFYQK